MGPRGDIPFAGYHSIEACAQAYGFPGQRLQYYYRKLGSEHEAIKKCDLLRRIEQDPEFAKKMKADKKLKRTVSAKLNNMLKSKHNRGEKKRIYEKQAKEIRKSKVMPGFYAFDMNPCLDRRTDY